MRFVFKINENQGDVSRISALWNGKSINDKSGKADGASLYIWNYSNAGYKLLEASADTESEIIVSHFGGRGGVGEGSITMWMYGDVLPLLVLRLQFCMESLEMAPYFEVLVWIWDGQGLFSGIPIAMNCTIFGRRLPEAPE